MLTHQNFALDTFKIFQFDAATILWLQPSSISHNHLAISLEFIQVVLTQIREKTWSRFIMIIYHALVWLVGVIDAGPIKSLVNWRLEICKGTCIIFHWAVSLIKLIKIVKSSMLLWIYFTLILIRKQSIRTK